MGRLWELLVLVRIYSDLQTLIPPWSFVYLDLNTISYGAAFQVTDWSWVLSTMPTGDFCVSLWLNVASPTSNYPNIMSYSTAGQDTSGLYFDNGIAIFDSSSVELTFNKPSFGEWFHLVYGFHAGLMYFALTSRAGAQDRKSQASGYQLTTATQLKAPAVWRDGDVFKVTSR